MRVKSLNTRPNDKRVKGVYSKKPLSYTTSLGSLTRAIDSLPLSDLIAVSIVTTARSKGINKKYPASARANAVITGIGLVQKRDKLMGEQLTKYVNHMIVEKNNNCYVPSERTKAELRSLMADD